MSWFTGASKGRPDRKPQTGKSDAKRSVYNGDVAGRAGGPLGSRYARHYGSGRGYNAGSSRPSSRFPR